MLEAGQDPQMVLQMVMQNFGAQQWDNHLAHIKVHLRTFKSPGVRDNQLFAWLFQQIINQHTMFMQGSMPVDPNAPPGQQPGQQSIPQDPKSAMAAVATNSPQSEGMQLNDQQILPSDGGNQ